MSSTPHDSSTGPAPERDAAEMVKVLYDELRQQAARLLRVEAPDMRLDPTALVHEAYLRLAEQRKGFGSRPQFLALAAQVMRRVVVDQARARKAAKRGGGAERVTLFDSAAIVSGGELDVLAVHDALEHLTSLNERHARVVEMRFFAGMTFEEMAEVLDLTSRTLKDDWRVARAWLLRELQGEAP